MATPSAAQYAQLLAQYEKQNEELRTRLYATFNAPSPHAVHPLASAMLGLLLGAILTAAVFVFVLKAKPAP